MLHCIGCNKKLRLWNTPMFNKGQTAEKSSVCCDCHTRLATQGYYYYMATNMKEFKNHEVSNALKKIQQTKR